MIYIICKIIAGGEKMGIVVCDPNANIKQIYGNNQNKNLFQTYSDTKKPEVSCLYEMLDESVRCQLSNLIYDLFEMSNKQILSILLNDQLIDADITYDKLADFIGDFLVYDATQEATDDLTKEFRELNEEDAEKFVKRIKSRIKKFTESYSVKTSNRTFEYVCSFLNLSEDALCTGRGKYFFLDKEKLNDLVQSKYKCENPQNEFARIILNKKFLFRYGFLDGKKREKIIVDHENNAISYLERSNKIIAKYAAEEFSIPLSDIYEEKDCSIVLSGYAFAEAYCILDDKKKRIVDRALALIYA